ncbi:MAG: DNA primase, partial [Planctomycetes bacterium]|nr:DNA primase [Planctomycetota bacterium]
MDRFEEAKLKIKQATDIVELIQNYVPLTRKGRYWVGLCPFHNEKTPSFSVNPDGFFKCFGCGKGGDEFTFLMEREGLSFREAMEALA